MLQDSVNPKLISNEVNLGQEATRKGRFLLVEGSNFIYQLEPNQPYFLKFLLTKFPNPITPKLKIIKPKAMGVR